MDQITVDAAIPVLKGMRVDKTECKHGGGDYGIETERGTAAEGDHPFDEGG